MMVICVFYGTTSEYKNAARLKLPQSGDRVEVLVALSPFPKKNYLPAR